MPIYEYLCDTCGPFNDFATMANFDAASRCPHCEEAAPRALLSVPHFSALSGARRNAFAINEKSSHAPETSQRSGKHPAGCGCCKKSTGAAKGFSGGRPWMISH